MSSCQRVTGGPAAAIGVLNTGGSLADAFTAFNAFKSARAAASAASGAAAAAGTTATEAAAGAGAAATEAAGAGAGGAGALAESGAAGAAGIAGIGMAAGAALVPIALLAASIAGLVNAYRTSLPPIKATNQGCCMVVAWRPAELAAAPGPCSGPVLPRLRARQRLPRERSPRPVTGCCKIMPQPSVA